MINVTTDRRPSHVNYESFESVPGKERCKILHSIKLCTHVSSPFSLKWSEDHKLAVILDKGINIYDWVYQSVRFPRLSFPYSNLQQWFLMILTILIFHHIDYCSTEMVTSKIFGNAQGFPAAFGDFNSDKKTDIFLISEDGRSVTTLVASDKEPYFKTANIECSFKDIHITGIIPGDFDGDSMMDILIVARRDSVKNLTRELHLLYGNLMKIQCPLNSEPVLKVQREPLALDYNGDMITDLLTTCGENDERCFWIFNSSRSKPKSIPMNGTAFRRPHSNSIIDLNGDMSADLAITSESNFELWYYYKNEYVLNQTIPYSNFSFNSDTGSIIGQSLFIDVDFCGRIDHIVPICKDQKCESSSIYLYYKKWINLEISFKDKDNNLWGFVYPDGGKYTDTLTIRSGDYTLDGYPDLLVTLQKKDGNPTSAKVFLLENIPCKNCDYPRTFEVKWDLLNYWNESRLGVFFDLYEDGTLDVLLVVKNSNNNYELAAFTNTVYADDTYLTVIVVSGVCYDNCSSVHGIAYGTNFPGPTVCYRTTSVVGVTTQSCAGQLYQSSHFALQLPYVHFGLGPVLQYIDFLRIGTEFGYNEWNQLIPNSQIIAIPYPVNTPSDWDIKLFVTRTKNIFYAFGALVGLMIFVVGLVVIFHWKEKHDDRKEKLQETQRFHFDAL